MSNIRKVILSLLLHGKIIPFVILTQPMNAKYNPYGFCTLEYINYNSLNVLVMLLEFLERACAIKPLENFKYIVIE